MECSFCHKNQATCHLTKLVNGKLIEVHVCDQCIPEINQPNLMDFDIWEAVSKLAAQKGMPDPSKAIEPDPAEISAKSLLLRPSVMPSTQCPVCGFSNEDIRKTGRLGCPDCYETFASILKDVLNDCQKGLQHLGKVPFKLKDLRRQRIEDELKRAIDAERFEDAAILRDQLAQLE
ncbi:MAG: UvrB/UvrC motif-containing protein [Verrucomicrobiota bacterium]